MSATRTRSRLPRTVHAGAAITLFFVFAALLSLWWTPYDTQHIAVIDRLQGPSLAHPFGTDQLGRDVLSMLMRGAATSLGVALIAVGIGVVAGGALGLWAAARGGYVDEIIMRGNDIVFAFPSLLLAILICTVFGPGAVNAIVAIGIFNIPVFARVVRAEANRLWVREFVLAARVAGKNTLAISLEHIVPNLASPLSVQIAIQFSLGIVAETALSYVGLGTQPPLASWGRMLGDAQTLTALAPSLALFPGLAVVASVLGCNLLGEGLRAHLDPRSAPHH